MTDRKSELQEDIQNHLVQAQIAELLGAYADEQGEWLCETNNRCKDYRPSKKLQRNIMRKIRKSTTPKPIKLKAALLIAALIALLLAVNANATRSLIANFIITLKE